MWLATAMAVVASAVFILTMVSVFLFALTGAEVPFVGRINPIGAIIVGYLYAVFLDWFLMLSSELLILTVTKAQHSKVAASATVNLLNLYRASREEK